MRRLRPALFAVTAAAAVLAALPAAATAEQFVVTCGSSHVRQDDPIVMPGQRGMSHWHEFFGARYTQATSTPATMRRSPTTCSDRFDTAGYWMPRLVVGNRQVPGSLVAWYSRGGKTSVQEFPADLAVVVGNARATTWQSTSEVFWRCEGRGSRLRNQRVPQCGSGEHLSAWFIFPDCWNGRQLDSADHRSHMSRSVRGQCPASHPRALPTLVMRVAWPVRPAPSTVRLGTDMHPMALHGDFWNTWNQRQLRQRVYECLNVHYDCGLIDNR